MTDGGAMEAVIVVLLAAAAAFAAVRYGWPRRADPRTRRLSAICAREHALGIRPCSDQDCAECRLFAARTASGRREWHPQHGGPATIVAVEQVPRYGQQIRLYHLDPIVAGDPRRTVEASHRLLTDAMIRFRIGDRVRFAFDGSRTGRSSGRAYFVYRVDQMP